VKPLLAGEIFAAECLAEPRGGSDFFGATCTAEDKGDHFLLYARTNPDKNAPPQQTISAFPATACRSERAVRRIRADDFGLLA
jgi:alkylation response protein AidB-like acyl-CoA dehydrogenase